MNLYEQINESISLAAEFHGRLGRLYERLAGEVEKERVAMLLDYLKRHKTRLQEGLKQYAAMGRQNQGERWMQYPPGGDLLSLKDIEPSADITVDDLVALAMELDDRLLAFYQEMADTSDLPPEARGLFKQLMNQAEQEKAKFVETAEQIKRT